MSTHNLFEWEETPTKRDELREFTLGPARFRALYRPHPLGGMRIVTGTEERLSEVLTARCK